MRETGGFALAAPNDAEHLRRSSNIVGTVGPELDRFVSQPAGNEETPGPTLQSYTLNAPRAMTGQYWNGTDQRLTRLIHHNYRAGWLYKFKIGVDEVKNPDAAGRKMVRAYGILGPALIASAIVITITGVVWAMHHDQIF